MPELTYDLHASIKAAAVDAIRALQLQEEGGTVLAKVYSQLFPDDTELTYACVVVTTEGELEEEIPGTTEHIDALYPLRVYIVDREGHRRHAKERTYLIWRQAIGDRFRHEQSKGLGGLPVQWCEVVPMLVFDPKLPQYQLVVSGLTLKFRTRRPRPAPRL